MDARAEDEGGNEEGRPEVLCAPRPSVAIMLSSAAAWAALRVEIPLGKNADVGWREGREEPRDGGRDGERDEAGGLRVDERAKGLLEDEGKLDGGAPAPTPVGLSGEGVNEAADPVRMGRCCCVEATCC